MSYLLDTNVICELVKVKPCDHVVKWVNECDDSHLFISVITLSEIRKGINGIKDEKRRERIVQWLDVKLPEYFGERILNIDRKVADRWGYLQCEKKGFTFPAIDSLIAATALAHQLTLVTRNTNDFINTSVGLVNPWDVL